MASYVNAKSHVMVPADNQPEQVTLAEAADLLGVHYMTAYRYVRTGRMYASKRGGKWWVDRSAVDAVRDEGTGPRRRADGASRTLELEPFVERLLVGDTPGCWDIITAALTSGAEPPEVHERLLKPALVRIGEGWADGAITIAAEHRATATVNRLIGQMHPLFRHPGRRRGTIVLGVVSGDPHALPSAMLSDLLIDRQFDAVDLGANTPVESFLDAAADVDDLVGIGVCVVLEQCVDAGRQALITLRDELPGCVLVAGGPAVAHDRAGFIGLADHVTATATEACDAFEAAALATAPVS